MMEKNLFRVFAASYSVLTFLQFADKFILSPPITLLDIDGWFYGFPKRFVFNWVLFIDIRIILYLLGFLRNNSQCYFVLFTGSYFRRFCS